MFDINDLQEVSTIAEELDKRLRDVISNKANYNSAKSFRDYYLKKTALT